MSQIIHINSIQDPRVVHYRNLKDRDLAARGGLFIAEGEHVVKRLLASRYETESVLLSEKRADEFARTVPSHVPTYVAPHEVMEQILGFKFHSGIIAAGKRGARRTIDEVVPKEQHELLLVILPDVHSVENIGSLVRLSAAFGADALILGERCHDPLFRQAVRVSMGTVFSLPLVQSDDLRRDILRLKSEWQVEMLGAVLDADAEELSRAKRPARMGLLFGNEAQGLARTDIELCDRKVTIPMKLGTDSLNVAVAAGIFLYHFTK